MDDCVWIISKNQPVANHLRFIIAVLNSIQDLERMADYIVSAAKFFLTHKKLDKDINKLIITVLEKSISTIAKIFDGMQAKSSIEAYEQTLSIQEEYSDFYNNELKKLAKIIKTKSVADIADILTGAVIVLKHIERNVDHATNISENFVYIKQYDFFFSKKSKQLSSKKNK